MRVLWPTCCMMNATSNRCPNVRTYVRFYVCITVNQSTEHNAQLICREWSDRMRFYASC